MFKKLPKLAVLGALATLLIVAAAIWARESGPSSAALTEARDRLRRPLVTEEIGDFIRQCLSEKGIGDYIDVITDPARIVLRDATDEVSDKDPRIQDCIDTTEDEFPSYFEFDPVDPVTESEFLVIYQLLLEVARCLEAEGYTVEAPSFRTFREGGGRWIPYEDIPPPPNQEDWDALNDRCPQTPWAYED